MISLTKIIFICSLLLFNYAYSNTINKIIFKLDNEIFTTIDLENRKKYLELLNNSKLVNDKFILKDLINISIYNKFFQKTQKKISKQSKDNLYNDLFKKYEINKKKDYFTDIYKDLTKDKIIQNITYDLQKKNIIEEKLNQQKDIIFKNNINELKLLYDIYIDYFLVEKNNIEKIKKIIKDINYTKINKELKAIQKINIKITHQSKKIQDIDNLDSELKSNILLDKKYFYFEKNSNIFIGKIIKKLKNEEKIDFFLYQILSKNEINQELIKCNNINFIKNNEEYIVKKVEINYNKINKDLKSKLISINDFVIYKNDNGLIYIILCQLNFDKNEYKQLYINENINNLAEEINTEFILINKKKYNFEIIND